jgi:hypothetical protein
MLDDDVGRNEEEYKEEEEDDGEKSKRACLCLTQARPTAKWQKKFPLSVPRLLELFTSQTGLDISTSERSKQNTRWPERAVRGWKKVNIAKALELRAVGVKGVGWLVLF